MTAAVGAAEAPAASRRRSESGFVFFSRSWMIREKNERDDKFPCHVSFSRVERHGHVLKKIIF